ncbi:hypothetical protein [Sphingomonas sp.]|jgi:hypothetical protein|uniref:hypothetical protein n=1 Tax=Sphingomonas sp. TaxID=28214 RepID=UPI002EDACF53
MAGMTPTNRRGRRAAAATVPAVAAIEPAVEAAAERAAIERVPGEPAAGAPVPVPAADLPAVDTAVLPEPTLIAEPGEPLPIVTASPILAAEPSALDVVQADAAAERVAAGMELAPAGDGPHPAAAGQPTLTIEGATADGVARALDSASSEMLDRRRAIVGERRDDVDRFDDLPSLDELLADLGVIMRRDPEAYWIVRDQLLADEQPGDRVAPAAEATPATVTVIEVVGPPQGRRRAGLTFGPQPRRFLAGELTEDDIAVLRADPLLAVGVSEVAEADALAPIAAGG